MFYGRGAGQMPTASAVWSDILETARRIAHGIPALALDLPAAGGGSLPLLPMEDTRCGYYLRVTAQDRPGVLSRVTGVLGEHGISIASMIQKGRATEAVPIVMMTHEAVERDVRAALARINGLPVVALPTALIRVEGGPA
jgi:homoserine dehydrogenase